MENPFLHRPLREFARRPEAASARAEAAGNIREARRSRDAAIAEARSRKETLNEIVRRIAEYAARQEHDEQHGTHLLERKLLEDLRNEEDALRRQDEQADAGVAARRWEPRKLLHKFYETQRNLWDHAPYRKEEIEKYFSEAYLATLNLDEYGVLLRRFPSELVTHVTRQGIRDHVGHAFHAAGLGERHRGFERILQTGKLNSAIGSWLSQGMEDGYIQQLLHLEEQPTIEELQDRIEELCAPEYQNNIGQGRLSYADLTAVHLATEEVADAYYGAEVGNECFFAFPSLHIASQQYFAGQLTRAGQGAMNDQYVWIEGMGGLNIHAGIVGIPEQTAVDRKTGSRYALNEHGEPEVQTALIERLDDLLRDPRIQATLREVQKKTERSAEAQQAYQDALKAHGVTRGDSLDDVCQDSRVAIYLLNQMPEKALRSLGLYYKPAQDPIPAKEYWEAYFTAHPDTRPQKILYYNGDPTTALQRWKDRMGVRGTLGRERDDHTQITAEDFSERQISPGDERTLLHMDLFLNRIRHVAGAYLREQHGDAQSASRGSDAA